MDSAYSIDQDQSKHAARANPDRHFSSPVNFPFQEALLYTYIPLRRNVSTKISLRGKRKLIWVDTLRRVILDSMNSVVITRTLGSSLQESWRLFANPTLRTRSYYSANGLPKIGKDKVLR